jgi:alpha-mannosidase
MATPIEGAIASMEVHLRSVIEPAVLVRRVRLDAAVHQTRERLTVGEVRRRAFKAVRPGWEWGPKWSTAWFRLRGTVPAEMRRLAGGQRGRVLALRFSTSGRWPGWMSIATW